MASDIADQLLVMLRRHEAANAAYDAAAARGGSEEERARLFEECRSTMHALAERAPPATTAASAAAALDHVLADDTLWQGPDRLAGEIFLRQLIVAARDYIRS